MRDLTERMPTRHTFCVKHTCTLVRPSYNAFTYQSTLQVARYWRFMAGRGAHEKAIGELKDRTQLRYHSHTRLPTPIVPGNSSSFSRTTSWSTSKSKPDSKTQSHLEKYQPMAAQIHTYSTFRAHQPRRHLVRPEGRLTLPSKQQAHRNTIPQNATHYRKPPDLCHIEVKHQEQQPVQLGFGCFLLSVQTGSMQNRLLAPAR